MQWLFLIGAILGTVLPLSYFLPFLMTHGLDAQMFWRQLFQNNISAFFAMDVFVSGVVVWLFVFAEGRRLGMKNLWVYMFATLLVGGSSGLPLFLFFRERQLNTVRHAQETARQDATSAKQ